MRRHHFNGWALVLALGVWLPLGPAMAARSPVATATSLVHSHRFKDAERLLTTQLKADPGHLQANLMMGRLEDYVGRTRESLAFFTRAAAGHPGSFEAQVMVAYSDLRNGKAQTALDRGQQLLERWGNRKVDKRSLSTLYVTMGAAQGMLAKHDAMGAVKYGLSIRGHFERAVSVDPTCAAAAYALGRYELEAPAFVGGSEPHGLSMIERAVRLDPTDYRIRAGYIRFLRAAHRESEAERQLERFRREFGDLPVALRALDDSSDRY